MGQKKIKVLFCRVAVTLNKQASGAASQQAIDRSPEVAMRSEPESQQSSLQLYLFLIVFAIDPLILSSDNRRVRALRGCGRGIQIMELEKKREDGRIKETKQHKESNLQLLMTSELDGWICRLPLQLFQPSMLPFSRCKLRVFRASQALERRLPPSTCP